ncbi:MAG: ABC transporter permease [Chloroflexi bacterium]|nr:ABC transporter permease [Chloroflexota bacterium]MBK6712053.1 ABC transporter permease [Chloroflexota bacterium]MBK7177349.1 ABC transporter permease [Chloroflexota bacterium]MBP6804652.1 ABC transporter permease [Chloroflexota bacterium]MBP7592939.1 ABC transporter permease [Chloroflexota bacterium]
MPVFAVLAAFAVGAVILLLQGVNPLEAYQSMIIGAFGSKNGLSDTLVKATPLLLVGLGIAIAFRGGVINIGAEGQIIMGSLFTTWVGLQLGNQVSGVIVIIIGLLAGAFMGGIWGAIPGYLKAQLGVNEILSTIMLNQIAIQIGYYLLRGPMMDPAEIAAGTNIPHSARLIKDIDMPRFTDIAQSLGITQSAKDLNLQGFLGEVYGVLTEPTRLHSGFIFAIIMAIVVYIFLWRTTIGYRIRAVGLNRHASRYAGMNVKRTMVLSMTLSGAFAGLAGAVEILGLHHRMFEPTAVSAGYGFSGIVAALFGKLHPLGIIPSSILFGGLLVGGDKMQRAMQVPQVLITAILGLVVLFVVSTDYIVRRRQNRRVDTNMRGEQPVEETAVAATAPEVTP